MELIIYFVTVFPIGLGLLIFAFWYDYKHVPTVHMESSMPNLKSLFKDPKESIS